MTTMHFTDLARPVRHVEPWRVRECILFIVVGCAVLWGAVAVLIS